MTLSQVAAASPPAVKTPRTRKATPEAIALRLAREGVGPIVSDINEALAFDEDGKALEALVSAVLDQRQDTRFTLDEECDLRDLIRTVLEASPAYTPEIGRMFVRLGDWAYTEAQAYAQAGYLVGVNVTRVAGGAR